MRRFSEVACLSRATRMNSRVVILLFLVERVKDNLKFRCWYEPTQKSLVVVGVLAVAETSDDIDLSVWKNTCYCPRAVAWIAYRFDYHGLRFPFL